MGGIAFILTGFLYAAVALAGALKNGFGWYMLSWFLTIAGAAFLVGALFLAVWYRKKTEKTNLPDKK